MRRRASPAYEAEGHPFAAFDADAPYSEDNVEQRPRLIRQAAPSYPAQALRRGVEADVLLSLVVDPRGRVREARVLRGKRGGFDEAALRAARELAFAPGRARGNAVAVRVTWTCRFRLDS